MRRNRSAEKQWCITNDYNFKVRTEKEIIKGRYYIGNASTIAARTRRYTPPVEQDYYNDQILKALEKYGELTYEDLFRNELLPSEELDHMCYMYTEGYISFDVAHKPIAYNMEVNAKEKN